MYNLYTGLIMHSVSLARKKLDKTFAQFSSNFHLNLAKIQSVCPWLSTISPTNNRMNTIDILVIMYVHNTYKPISKRLDYLKVT